MLGKLLSMPLRIANAPLRAVDHLLGDGEEHPDHSILSAPLESVARAVEEAADIDEKK